MKPLKALSLFIVTAILATSLFSCNNPNEMSNNTAETRNKATKLFDT